MNIYAAEESKIAIVKVSHRDHEEHWAVMVDGVKAGKAYTELGHSDGLIYFSIFLNKPFQGRGIGKVVYRQCALDSKFPVIYAVMRKSNKASLMSALSAGYRIVQDEPGRQLLLKFEK